jgi:hypothetical protein
MTALALLLAAQSFDDAVQPHAALGPGGTAVVAMIRGGNIIVAVSADAGKSFGAPVTAIDAGGRASGGMRRGPRVGVDKKGGLVVTAPDPWTPRPRP